MRAATRPVAAARAARASTSAAALASRAVAARPTRSCAASCAPGPRMWCTSTASSIALTMAATMRTVPVVLSLDTTVHDWWSMPAWRRRAAHASITIAPSRALERRALRGAALVLAWTRLGAPGGRARGARARASIEHHPGLDLHRYRPAARRERERPRVLFVGGRFAEKGGEDLLRRARRAARRRASSSTSSRTADGARAPGRARPPAGPVRRAAAGPPTAGRRAVPADPRGREPVGAARGDGLRDAGRLHARRRDPRHARATAVRASSCRYGDPPRAARGPASAARRPARRARLAGRARLRCEERYDARRQFAALAERLARLSSQAADQAGALRRSSSRTSSTSSARSPNSSAG